MTEERRRRPSRAALQRWIMTTLMSPRNRYILLASGVVLFTFIHFLRSGTHGRTAHTTNGSGLMASGDTWHEDSEQLLRKAAEKGGYTLDLRTSENSLRTAVDVEGSSVDHQTSTSNPCLTQRSLLQRAYMEEQPAALSSFGQHRFLLLNGYRTDLQEFAAVGLYLRVMRHFTGNEGHPHCRWLGSDGTLIEGHVTYFFPGEHHRLMYETVVYRCSLPHAPAVAGGSAVLILDGDPFLVYEEVGSASVSEGVARLRQQKRRWEGQPTIPLAFCSFPMYRSVNDLAIKEWLQIAWQYLRVQYFILYDAGTVSSQLFNVLKRYLNAGVMEIVDIRGSYMHESKHNVLALNDCLYRTRALPARWTLFMDFDEFLFIRPPHNLVSLLRQNRDVPFLTFGSLWWSINYCRPGWGQSQLQSALQRAKFHWPHFYCVGQDSMGYTEQECLNYFGHRKFIVNPRKVHAVQIHRPINPLHGGLHVSTEVAYINHYQGLLIKTAEICNDTVDGDRQLVWWTEDNYMADISKTASRRGGPRPWFGTRKMKRLW